MRLSAFRLAAMSSLWLTWNAQSQTIAPTVVPQAVKFLVPQHPELWTGCVVGAGATVALIVPPVAGALSDRSGNPSGRRRRYVVGGVLASCAALVFFGWAQSTGLAVLIVAYLMLQFWWNWAAGPYTGLIPDVVPAEQYGEASGWMSALTFVGIIVGSAALYTYRPEQPWPMIAVFIALNVACAVVTLVWVREPTPDTPPPWPGLRTFARSFYLPLADNRDFYLVLVTRLLTNMGLGSVISFLVLYLQFVVGVPARDATRLMSTLLGAGAVLAIGASFAATRLIGRLGVVRTVQGSSWALAFAAVMYTLISVAPRLVFVIPVALIFAIAMGVFAASDWALALAVLPKGQDVGKDFGIWHVCMVLPNVFGPVTTGVLITVARRDVSAPFAYGLVFGFAAVWFIAASVPIGKLRIRPRDSQTR